MDLYLTPKEREEFEQLPETLREGWRVIEETLTFADTVERREMRLHLLRMHDPKLLALREKALALPTTDAVVTLILESNLSGVSDADLAELFFALGPAPLSFLIPQFLTKAHSDEDLEHVAIFSGIRHSLLASLQPA